MIKEKIIIKSIFLFFYFRIFIIIFLGRMNMSVHREVIYHLSRYTIRGSLVYVHIVAKKFNIT